MFPVLTRNTECSLRRSWLQPNQKAGSDANVKTLDFRRSFWSPVAWSPDNDRFIAELVLHLGEQRTPRSHQRLERLLANSTTVDAEPISPVNVVVGKTILGTVPAPASL